MEKLKRPPRKYKMNDEALKTWMVEQCEEIPAPYPDLDSSCLIWTGPLNSQGYGLTNYKRKRKRAHRVMFYLTHGRWPIDQLCHKCDRPACVAISHLFEGSQQENVDDMVRKNRNSKGERQPQAKVTESQVREIRTLASQGTPFAAIGRLFNMSGTNVKRIVSRSNWQHVA